ncbi:glycosyltransferase [Puteibacter caeruleilacunae]|nr:glycosyltransferase [Puteibacter caeruleilacunae]
MFHHLKVLLMKFKVTLIISTYNRPDALKQTLNSILYQSKNPDEVIIADDGSNGDTHKLILEYKKRITCPIHHIWHPDKGYRLAAIRNKALKKASSDYIIFIDGDIILDVNFIEDHLSIAKPDYFVNGSRVILSEKVTRRITSGRTCSNILEGAKNKLNGYRIPWLHKLISGPTKSHKRIRGCNMAFWKKDLENIGGYDERYIGWGLSDSDLVIRLMKSGIKRKNMKFLGICYHLYHEFADRSNLFRNQQLFLKTLKGNV